MTGYFEHGIKTQGFIKKGITCRFEVSEVMKMLTVVF